jgi:phosphoglycolate phosphatase
MRDTIVFDLDGTLADTAGDLIAAANAALAALGHGPALRMGDDDATAFRGGRAMLELGDSVWRCPTGRRWSRMATRSCWRPTAAGDRRTHTTLYPGVVAAVERLRARGAATSICTNKPEALAIDLIDRLSLSHLFDALVGADTLPVRKPDPAPFRAAVDRSGGTLARSLLVGDTVTDRKTAAAAGVPCVLVTFGPSGRAVADLAPEALLDHYDDLDRVIATVLRAGDRAILTAGGRGRKVRPWKNPSSKAASPSRSRSPRPPSRPRSR